MGKRRPNWSQFFTNIFAVTVLGYFAGYLVVGTNVTNSTFSQNDTRSINASIQNTNKTFIAINITGSANVTNCTTHPLFLNITFTEVGQEDRRCVSNRIAKFYNTSMSACTARCIRKTNCVSVNFHVDAMVCEMVGHGGTSLATEDGWTFFKNTHWAENTTQDCRTKPCTGLHRCVDLTHGGHMCILTHCDKPPDIPGAHLSSDNAEDYTIGNKLTYSCYPAALKAGNPEITCQADGRWSSTLFECQCREPPSVAVVPGGSGRGVGIRLTYQCRPPLLTNGNASHRVLTCQKHGGWLPTSPEVYCRCPTAPTPNAGTKFITKTGRTVWATWRAACISPLAPACVNCKPQGSARNTTCLKDGSWSVMNFTCTYCVGISCV